MPPGNRESKLSYQARGDRCEGILARPISDPIHLRLLGYHAVKPSYDLSKDAFVSMEVTRADSHSELPLILRMMSVRWGLDYQLDTTLPSRATVFRFNTDILSAPEVDLSPKSVAALACSPDCSSRPGNRYFPVRLEERKSQRAPRPYAVFAASTEIVAWHLRVYDPSGNISARQDATEHVLSNVPFNVPLGDLGPGLVEIEIVAEAEQGSASFRGSFYLPVR